MVHPISLPFCDKPLLEEAWIEVVRPELLGGQQPQSLLLLGVRCCLLKVSSPFFALLFPDFSGLIPVIGALLSGVDGQASAGIWAFQSKER